MTKEERKIYNRLHYQKNIDKKKLYDKKYQEKNKDKKKLYNKQYQEKNKEIIKNKRVEKKSKIKEYYLNNIDKIKKYKKEYRKLNKNKINEYNKIKRQQNNLFRISSNIRNLIRTSFKRNNFKKTSKTHKILGCSFEKFKTHLESKFEPWMNWNNYGKYNGKPNFGWDFDHIIPASHGKTEEEIIKLNHYTNIQPLCSYINRDIKKDKI